MRAQVTIFILISVLCASVNALSPNELFKSLKKKIIDPVHDWWYGVPKNNVENVTTERVGIETPVNQQFPHAVMIGRACGGTIISDKWLLTAAHCLAYIASKLVYAGSTNILKGNKTIRVIKRQVIHPLFSVGPYWVNAKRFNIKQVAAHYDYLLIELDKPLPLDNATMAAAKLDEGPLLPAKTKVSYGGFGASEYRGPMGYSMHVRKLETLSDGECSFLPEYNLADMICAKGKPPKFDSACNGDSGSGLVDENGVLVGVLSWAQNDAIECRNGAIVYFAKVAAVRNWIREVTSI